MAVLALRGILMRIDLGWVTLKNGNQEQRSGSKGLEGKEGGQCNPRDLQTQEEGAKDSTVALEKPATGPLTRNLVRTWIREETRLRCGERVASARPSTGDGRTPWRLGPVFRWSLG